MLTSKQDYRNLTMKILNPLKRLALPLKSGYAIGPARAWYDEKAMTMESFSRPIWALGPFWHGGGSDAEFEQAVREGLAAGCDPKGAEYWGEPSDCDQRFVEMAAIGCALILAPEKVWDPLPERDKSSIAAYLYKINEYTQCPNNWQYFNVLTNLGLRSVGRRYSKERMDAALDFIDGLYLGDGWYIDGTDSTIDYYNPFALHYYGLLYSVFNAKEDPVRAERYRARAEVFAHDFIYWFDESGDALPIGRSLTYRFAQAAFWSACVFAEVKPFPLGVMKGIISRNLEAWMEKPVFDNAGVLTIGYGYQNTMMAEHYNAPGSPYWAMKTMLVLALPDDHPFWSAECEPLPKLDPVHAIPRAGMVMTRKNGAATAYTTGNCANETLGHIDSKYAKFAYSATFGFCVPYSNLSLFEFAPDSMSAFEVDGFFYAKRKNKSSEITSDGRVITEWSPVKGIDVKTVVIPSEKGHIRQTTVTAEYPCVMYDCGFAARHIADGTHGDTKIRKRDTYVRISSGYCVSAAKGGGKPEAVRAAQNTNILYPDVWIPCIKYDIKKGTQKIVTEFTSYKKRAVKRHDI